MCQLKKKKQSLSFSKVRLNLAVSYIVSMCIVDLSAIFVESIVVIS